MTRKLFGTKSITHLIYGLIMLLPFAMVLGRVCYTVVNKNAKNSYSNANIVEKTSIVARTGNLQDNINYTLKLDLNLGSSAVQYFKYKEISIEWTDYGAPSGHNYDEFGLYKATNNYYVYLRENNTIIYTFWSGNTTFGTNWTFSFINNGDYALNGNQPCNIYFYTFTTATLDNAFEYSLSQFTDDNNLGSIDFFGWFTNLFLNQTNSHNMIYLNFANWYMNYALLVSSGYLLFLALLWFINYVRRILDKSMNQDYGGF